MRRSRTMSEGMRLLLCAVGSAGSLSPLASKLTVYLLHLVVPLLVLVLGLLRALRLSRRARDADTSYAREYLASDEVRPGPALLHGTVAFAPGRDVAVRVAVQQSGIQQMDVQMGYSHQWRESGREVTLQPFYLLEDRGRRIRVEPADNTLLVDDPDRIESVAYGERVRIAELSEGEEIYAAGEVVHGVDSDLPGGYRGGGQNALVLRAPARDRLLLSAKPLSAPYRDQLRRERPGLIVLALLFIGFQMSDLRFHLQAMFGDASANVSSVAAMLLALVSIPLAIAIYVTAAYVTRPWYLGARLDDDMRGPLPEHPGDG